MALNAPLQGYAGPGAWNDADMLEVGNGMSFEEDKTHFTMWCMMASPLILGNDLRNMSNQTLGIISNKVGLLARTRRRLGLARLAAASPPHPLPPPVPSTGGDCHQPGPAWRAGAARGSRCAVSLQASWAS